MTLALDKPKAGVRVRGRLTRGHDPVLLISGAVVGIMVAIAIFGPLLAPHDPDQIDILAVGQGPSSSHWLGVDSLGRDILSRALVGARLSLLAPALIVALSAFLGCALAIFAAWHGGWVDRTTNSGLNVMFALPGILVAVLAAAIFGAGFWAPVIALAIVYTPYAARVMRSVAVTERQKEYVESLQLAGMSSLQINMRHLLPNVSPILIAQTTFAFGIALADFAAISFIGLGIQPPQAEWGVMVSDGASEILEGSVAQSLVAGTLIVVTVVAFNVLGARLAARAEGQS
jgi:peptide/nickel transport system permease protein